MNEPQEPDSRKQPDAQSVRIRHRWSARVRTWARRFSIPTPQQVTATVVAGTALLAVISYLAGGFVPFAELQRRFSEPPISAGPDTLFTILVADLAYDDEGRSHTQDMVDALQVAGGVRIVRERAVLAVSTVGDVGQNLMEAESEGREWLRQRDADVLLWGRVSRERIRVRVLSQSGAGGLPIGLPAFGQELSLPSALGEELGYHLLTLAFANISLASGEPTSVQNLRLLSDSRVDHGTHLESPSSAATSPRHHRVGRAAVRVLTPTVLKLKRLLTSRALSGGIQQALLHRALGEASLVLGEAEADTFRLREAIASFRVALVNVDATQNRADAYYSRWMLGRALVSLGYLKSDTALVREAVQVFLATAEVFPNSEALLPRAQAQVVAGVTSVTLAYMEGGLQGALTAVSANERLVAVAEALAPGDPPAVWARLEFGMGLAAQYLGVRGRSADHLWYAVSRYSAAVEHLDRREEPGIWLILQMLYAEAQSQYAEVKPFSGSYIGAAGVYREILAEPSLVDPLRIPELQYALGRALEAGSETPGRPKDWGLAAAIEAYRSAVAGYARDGRLLSWARAQNSLGVALHLLGDRTGLSWYYIESDVAHRSAIDVLELWGSEDDLGLVRMNLAMNRFALGWRSF